MDTTKNQLGIIALDNNKLDYYSLENDTTVPFAFSKESVKQGDVINGELLSSRLITFLQENKIKPCVLYIVILTQLCFEKDFIEGQAAQQDILIQTFIDTIPYELVSSIKIPINKGFKVIATNRELYKTIQTVFESQGFTTQAVLPESIVGTIQMNNQGAKIIMQKMENAKSYNFLSPNETYTKEKTSERTQNKNRTVISIFIVCMIISLLLILRTFGFL